MACWDITLAKILDFLSMLRVRQSLVLRMLHTTRTWNILCTLIHADKPHLWHMTLPISGVKYHHSYLTLHVPQAYLPLNIGKLTKSLLSFVVASRYNVFNSPHTSSGHVRIPQVTMQNLTFQLNLDWFQTNYNPSYTRYNCKICWKIIMYCEWIYNASGIEAQENNRVRRRHRIGRWRTVNRSKEQTSNVY